MAQETAKTNKFNKNPKQTVPFKKENS